MGITFPYHKTTLENSSLKEVVEPNASLAFRKDWKCIQLSSVSSAVISDNRVGAGIFVRVVSPQAVERSEGEHPEHRCQITC